MPKYIPKCKLSTRNIAGFKFPNIISPEQCLSGQSYAPTPDDIFIVTYPKSGTAWTQYIVWEILNSGAPLPSMNEMQSKYMSFLEFAGQERVKELSTPRMIKTHLPRHLAPYHPLAKYIYIARNPKDTCVSFYHHVKQLADSYAFSDGTLDDFFEWFLLGEMPYGDWFNHVLSWYEHKDDPNVLFLTYEMMKRDPRGSISTIARFLGEDCEQRLTSDPSLLALILENTSFDSMKKMDLYVPKVDSNSEFHAPQSQEEAKKFNKVNFFWRGKVGNWKEFLTEEQAERLNEMVLSRPRGKEIAALWDE